MRWNVLWHHYLNKVLVKTGVQEVDIEISHFSEDLIRRIRVERLGSDRDRNSQSLSDWGQVLIVVNFEGVICASDCILAVLESGYKVIDLYGTERWLHYFEVRMYIRFCLICERVYLVLELGWIETLRWIASIHELEVDWELSLILRQTVNSHLISECVKSRSEPGKIIITIKVLNELICTIQLLTQVKKPRWTLHFNTEDSSSTEVWLNNVRLISKDQIVARVRICKLVILRRREYLNPIAIAKHKKVQIEVNLLFKWWVICLLRENRARFRLDRRGLHLLKRFQILNVKERELFLFSIHCDR